MSFDLNKAINTWKTQLRKYQGFEDADIAELEDHFRSRMEERMEDGSSAEEAFRTIYANDYQHLAQVSAQFREHRTTSALFPGLLSNYLKVGLRSFLRQKTYFGINLIGLIIGLTSVLYILFYVHYETNYDTFHDHGENIYRVNTRFERASGVIHYPIIPPAFGPAIKANVSDAIATSRLRYAYNILMQYEAQSFYEEKVFFAEAAFLEMFSFEWLHGQPEKALSEINTVVLTERMANKYFGESNPIGETIVYNNEIPLQVIGVIKNVPANSHFTFDFLVSFDTFKPGPGALEPMTSWAWLGFLTYVQLSPETDIAQVEGQLRDLFMENTTSTSNLDVQITLQPLKDIYLTSGDISNPQGGIFKVNDPENLISLVVIAVLIIVISFFNYFNISSALMRTRAKEIGIRKVFGTSKRKVFVQMGAETLLIMVQAAIISWACIGIFIKNDLLQVSTPTLSLMAGFTLALIILFVLVSGLLFGSTFSSYPAMALLKNKLHSGNRKFGLGSIVLLLQFSISAALIMVSMVVISQLNFFTKKDLGYDAKGMLVAKYRSEEMFQKKQAFTDAMMRLPEVTAVSFGPSLNGSTSGSPLRLAEWPEEQVIQTSYFGVDYQFNQMLDLDIVEGRYFSKSFAQDSVSSILVNEQLAAMLGLEDPIGARVAFTSGEFEIIGVFEDFHYKSLHHQIGPMALVMWLGQPRSVLIRYNTTNLAGTLQHLESTWQEVFASDGFPFDYRFLDDQLQSMYQKEQEFATMLKIFTGLAIFLALLGLFGLSSINIQQKIKQIGIRRVLGAELQQIAGVVSQRYLITCLVGMLIALPFAFRFMLGWLENYAYSIQLDLRFPVLTVAAVLGITVLTLAVQVYRVMTVNPSKILRDE